MPGTNMKMERDGDILKIEIDLAQEHGRSKSGSTTKVASSGGFMSVPDPDGRDKREIILSLNCNKRD